MGCPVIATARGCSSGRAGEAAGPRRPGGRTCCWRSTGAGPPTCGRPARRPQGLSPDGRDGPRPHGEASRGGFDGVLARRARGRPGNARTGGEAETPSGCRTTCSPRRGIVLVRDDPSTRPVGSPCETSPPREAERLVSRLEARHTPRHVSRQLTEQGHPARAISPKPARACICRQRRSRSPQRPLSSR